MTDAPATANTVRALPDTFTRFPGSSSLSPYTGHSGGGARFVAYGHHGKGCGHIHRTRGAALRCLRKIR